mmetsp:Transcript_44627/g.124420  ORF Transcript_44627/g.124420 Transcript_44627/m.124420 type:complete len:277 (+) Transcript_44627:527-1357(+)
MSSTFGKTPSRDDCRFPNASLAAWVVSARRVLMSCVCLRLIGDAAFDVATAKVDCDVAFAARLSKHVKVLRGGGMLPRGASPSESSTPNCWGNLPSAQGGHGPGHASRLSGRTCWSTVPFLLDGPAKPCPVDRASAACSTCTRGCASSLRRASLSSAWHRTAHRARSARRWSACCAEAMDSDTSSSRSSLPLVTFGASGRKRRGAGLAGPAITSSTLNSASSSVLVDTRLAWRSPGSPAVPARMASSFEAAARATGTIRGPPADRGTQRRLGAGRA